LRTLLAIAVLLCSAGSCAAGQGPQPPCAGVEPVPAYAAPEQLDGGRVFASHYSYVWLYNDTPFSTTANWAVDGARPGNNQIGFINTTFPRGASLATWLVNVKATPTLGQIPIQVLRNDVHGLPAGSKSLDWMDIKNPAVTMHYTFDTPVGTPPAQQCGRVLYDDFHVENVGDSKGMLFPTECAAGPTSSWAIGSPVGSRRAPCLPCTGTWAIRC